MLLAQDGADPAASTATRRSRRVLLEVAAVGPFVLVGVAAVVWAVLSFDLPPVSAGRALGVVVLTQVVPGAVLWRAVRPREAWFAEDLAMGLAIGAALAVVAQVLAAMSGVGAARWLLGPVAAAAVLSTRRGRRQVRHAQWTPLPWWWGPLGVLACVGPVRLMRGTAFDQPVQWQGWASRFADTDFHLALVGELMHRWPPSYPFWSAEPLDYHWFSHAWVGQVAASSGVEAEMVLLRVVPPVLAVGAPLLIAVLGTRVGGPAVGAAGAVVGTTVGGMMLWGGRWSNIAVASWSPSQPLGVLLLAGALVVLVVRWRSAADPPSRGSLPGSTWPLLALLLVVAGGTKGTVLPLVVVGLVAALVAALLTGAPWRRVVLLDLVTAVVALGLLVTLVFRGGGALEVAPWEGLIERGGELAAVEDPTGVTATALVAMVIAVFAAPALVALGIASCDRGLRRDPVFWLLVGIMAAASGAVVLLQRVPASQWHFLSMAALANGLGAVLVLHRVAARAGPLVPVVGLVGGLGLSLALRRTLGRTDDTAPLGSGAVWTTLVVFVLALLLLGVLTALLARVAGPPRDAAQVRLRLAPTVAVVVLAGAIGASAPGSLPWELGPRMLAGPEPGHNVSSEFEPGTTPSALVGAMRWLRDRSDPEDLLAVNRHCRRGSGPECDHRVFSVSAFSERRVLLETWAYTNENNRRAQQTDQRQAFLPFWDDELLELNDGFFAAPTDEGADALWERGVRWLVVDLRSPRPGVSLAPWAEEVHTREQVRVLRLLPSQERSSATSA